MIWHADTSSESNFSANDSCTTRVLKVSKELQNPAMPRVESFSVHAFPLMSDRANQEYRVPVGRQTKSKRSKTSIY